MDREIVRIDERSFRRLKTGYPWVFRSEVLNVKQVVNLPSGQIVDFVREKGDFVARGFFNPKPQLVGRVLTTRFEEQIDSDFIFRKIEIALHFRDSLYSEPFYRLIHAESDGMPGVIIDRYGDVLSCQINTAGMDALWSHIEEALKTLIKPKTIILKNDTASRETEGLEMEVKLSYGSLDGAVQIEENETKFLVDLLEGQKTGWFFDQRDNRAWVAEMSKGKSIIDIFCHTGGFGITAGKKGAESITFVDSSAPALKMVEKNSALNGIADSCETIEGKAFEVMEELERKGKLFDVVSVDPPAFIKSRKDMASGMKGYSKLAKLAAPLVKKGGILFFASCSHHADVKELADNVAEGISKSGRPFQLIKTSGAAPDHPVNPFLPETGYLKAFTYRFLD